MELYLLLDPIYIQVIAVGMDVKEKRPFSSSPSKTTEPWILAVDCGDDEYLDNMAEPILWKCEDCPQGAYCRGPTTWSDVRPLNGYWRVPWQLDQFERCPFVGDCSGVDASDGRRRKYGANGTETNASATDGCIVGTTGILCSQCSPGFNREANICLQCEDNSMPIRIAVFLVVVVLVLVLFWSCKRKLKKGWRKYRSLYRDVLRIVSIFVTFSQINTSIPSIIEVPWPQEFVNFVAKFNVVNIDIFSLIGVSCVGNFNFYIGFCMMVCMPVAIVLWLLVALSTSIKAMKKRVQDMPDSDKALQQEEAYRML